MTRNHYYTVTTYPQLDSGTFIPAEFTKRSPPRHTPKRQKRRVVKEIYGIKSETKIFRSKKTAKEHIKKKRLSSSRKTELFSWWG